MPAPLLCKTDLPIEGAPRLSGTFPQVLKTHRASPASTPAGDCPRCPPESLRSSSEHVPPLPPAFLLPITALFPSVQSALLWEDMPAQVGRPFAAALFCFSLSYSSHGPGTSVCFRNGAISTLKTHHLSEVPQAGEAQSSLPPEPGLFFADRLDHMSHRHSHLGPQPLLSLAQLLFQEGTVGPAQVSYPRRSPRPSVKQTFFSGPHLWD